MDIRAVPENPLQDVPLQLKNQEGLHLMVFVENKMLVTNKSDKDVSIPVGSFLCGFGKGKFARSANGNFNPDCHHMLHIKTCDDVVHASKMVSVKEVVAEQKAKNPEAKIAYHSMFEMPSKDQRAFGVQQEHEVFFAPAFSSEDEAGQNPPVTQTSVAGKLPANAFEGLHCVVKGWGVKWGAIGLTPIRPVVLFKVSCDIPAGQALSLM